MSRIFKAYPVDVHGTQPYPTIQVHTEDEGKVSALVSIWDVVDYQGDRVRHGAFANSLEKWRKSGNPIPIVVDHVWSPDGHVGWVDPRNVEEVDEGLLAHDMQFDLDDPKAARVFQLIKQRRIKEWSWAYDTIRENKLRDGSNELLEVEIIEISATMKGANPHTRTLSAKNAPQATATRSVPRCATCSGILIGERHDGPDGFKFIRCATCTSLNIYSPRDLSETEKVQGCKNLAAYLQAEYPHVDVGGVRFKTTANSITYETGVTVTIPWMRKNVTVPRKAQLDDLVQDVSGRLNVGRPLTPPLRIEKVGRRYVVFDANDTPIARYHNRNEAEQHLQALLDQLDLNVDALVHPNLVEKTYSDPRNHIGPRPVGEKAQLDELVFDVLERDVHPARPKPRLPLRIERVGRRYVIVDADGQPVARYHNRNAAEQHLESLTNAEPPNVDALVHDKAYRDPLFQTGPRADRRDAELRKQVDELSATIGFKSRTQEASEAATAARNAASFDETQRQLRAGARPRGFEPDVDRVRDRHERAVELMEMHRRKLERSAERRAADERDRINRERAWKSANVDFYVDENSAAPVPVPETPHTPFEPRVHDDTAKVEPDSFAIPVVPVPDELRGRVPRNEVEGKSE